MTEQTLLGPREALRAPEGLRLAGGRVRPLTCRVIVTLAAPAPPHLPARLLTAQTAPAGRELAQFLLLRLRTEGRKMDNVMEESSCMLTYLAATTGTNS